jgi:hypothetical protein
MTKYTVRGPRVILTPPVIKQSLIEVDDKLKRELMEKEMRKWHSLTVLAAGDEVVGIEVGDEVYVNPIFLHNAERIEIDGIERMIIRAADISIVWK